MNLHTQKSQKLIAVCAALALIAAAALITVNLFKAPQAHAANLPFTVDSISPAAGPDSGGNVISLHGEGFPYTSSESVVQNGLVAQWDAINNTGEGDARHSTSTTTWKNLKSDVAGADFTQGTSPAGKWTDAGYEMGATADSVWRTIANPSDFGVPVGSAARTVELIYSLPENIAQAADLFTYGLPSAGSWWLQIEYDSNFCSTTPTRILGLSRYASNAYISASDIANDSLGSCGKIYTNSITYDGTTPAAVNGFYIAMNGKRYTPVNFDGGNVDESAINTADNPLYFGSRFQGGSYSKIAKGFKLHSLRIYNRDLTSSELAQNAAVDQIRYTAAPKVKIGSLDCPAAVVSTSQINCTVPAQSAGKYPIYVSYAGSGDVKVGEYTYIPSSAWQSLCGFKIYPAEGVSCSGSVLTISNTASAYLPPKQYVISSETNTAVWSGGSNHSIMVSGVGKTILNVVSDLNSQPSSQTPPLYVADGSSLTLNITDSYQVNAVAPDSNANETYATGMPGVAVPQSAHGEGTGSGKLTAKGAGSTVYNASGAGIGLGCQGAPGGWDAAGFITLSGSVSVEASSGKATRGNGVNIASSAAGIGGGSCNGRSGSAQTNGVKSIRILDDASVVASSGAAVYSGAAIGSGGVHGANTPYGGNVGEIYIDTRGKVTATASQGTQEVGGGAGIGSGANEGNWNGPDFGTITIKNGQIEAKGSPSGRMGGAGIGLGASLSRGTVSGQIIIDGGVIFAQGGTGQKNGAPGIGGSGADNGQTDIKAISSVKINGGSIVALGRNADGSARTWDSVAADSSTYRGVTNALGQAIFPVYIPETFGFGELQLPDFTYNSCLSTPLVSARMSGISGVCWLPGGTSDQPTREALLGGYTANQLLYNVYDVYAPVSTSPQKNYLYTASITAAPVISTASLTFKVADNSEQFIKASGGGISTWNITSGTLPQGLFFNPVNGKINGTPAASEVGSHTIKVTAKNSKGTSAEKSIVIQVTAGTPRISQNLSVQQVFAGHPLYDSGNISNGAVQVFPSVALNGASCSGTCAEGFEIADTASFSSSDHVTAINANTPLTAAHNGKYLRYKYSTTSPPAEVYSNVVQLQVQSWGVSAVAVSVPNNTSTSAPTDKKVTFTITPGSVTGAPTPQSYCISADTDTNFDYSSTSDPICGDTSASNTNWKASTAGTSQTLDLTTFNSAAWANPGVARTVTVYAKSADGLVSAGTQKTFTLNSVDFKANGDRGVNCPQLASETTETAAAACAAGGTAIPTYYALSGTPLNTLPANPSMPGFTANGWVAPASAPESYAECADVAGHPGTKPATGNYCIAPNSTLWGSATALTGGSSGTEISSNLVAYQKWTYTPKVLDFSPKKGLKSGGDALAVVGDSFVPWGKTIEQAKQDMHIYIGEAGTQELCTDESITLVNKFTVSCTSAEMPAGATYSGKVRVAN